MTNHQKDRLLRYLQDGYTVHRINALKNLGILELSARIVQLEQDGYEITKGWIELLNRYNEKYRLRTYKINK